MRNTPAFYVSNNTTPSNVFDDSVFTSTTKYSRWYIRQTSDGVVIESGLNSSALRMYATDGVYNNRYGKTEPGNVFLGGSGYVRNDVWTLVRESDVPAEPKQAGRHYWQGDGGLYLAVSYRGQPAIGDGMYLTSDAVPPIYMIEWIDTDRFVMRLDSYAFDNYLYLSQKDGKIIMDVRGNADIYTIKEEISGKYSIVNRSNYSITRTADNKVVLSPYTGSSNQLWMLGM